MNIKTDWKTRGLDGISEHSTVLLNILTNYAILNKDWRDSYDKKIISGRQGESI